MVGLLTHYKYAFFITLFICTLHFQAQNKSVYNTKYIDQLIENDSLQKAEKELQDQTQFYTNNKQYDSLSNLIHYHVKIALLKGENNFSGKSKNALKQLKSLTNSPEALYNAYAEMATLTFNNGMYQESYNYNKQGYEQAKKTATNRLNKMAKSAYGLSSTSYFMSKFDLAKKHGIEAFKINQSNPKATATNVYSACNIVGLIMQNENKLDSALFYYNKGADALKSTSSIFWQALKAKPLLYKSKAAYKRIDTTNVKAVLEIYKTLKNAIEILNTSSSKYVSNVDKSEYLSKIKPVLGFTMQISLKLYKMTKNTVYLEQLISMHESGIYNKIRSQLSIRDHIKFKDVPQDIIEKENTIKKNLNLLRNAVNLDENSIQKIIATNNEWLVLLDDLKKKYPKYYNMRYKTTKLSLKNIQHNIPKNTTVVKYLYVNSNLFAFIATKKSTAFYKLSSVNLEELIQLASNNITELESSKKALYQLYKQLWTPFEKAIKTKNIIIIPDGALFNLSFESLTPKKINSFKALTTNSLLAKHNISYNYSLLLGESSKTVYYKNDFIAFAPEFNDKMKADYKIAITDSIALDKTYLKLLPQPFSVDAAKKFSKLFNGSSFVNEKASKQIFKNKANAHKIIHIGTHAESNNTTPGLSRLIFAKNAKNDDNSLYTYQIYNENLNSNLTILAASETGKPTYQAGQGMISLAHAFNYAGSESILTSLWKTDEQSSAKIIELFYKNIKNGFTKDKALQQAKLDYLAQAEGRTLAPQYWAGLVLIGDASAIELQADFTTVFYWVLAIFTIMALLFFIYKIKTKKTKDFTKRAYRENIKPFD